MNKVKIVVIRCEAYADDQVLKSIKTGLALLDGISAFVKPGDKVVIMPNVLIGTNPVKSVTTHPAVFRVVGELMKERLSKDKHCLEDYAGGSIYGIHRPTKASRPTQPGKFEKNQCVKAPSK